MPVALGRYVYGLAAIACGISGLVFHDFAALQQVAALGDASHHQALTYLVGIVEILGGAAVLWPGTLRAGAATLAVLYLAYTLLSIAFVAGHPIGYNAYGNFFEQLSFGTGAAIMYAYSGAIVPRQTPALARIAYYAFGACVVSFALEQYFYLAATASFVPKWIPPGQMFWAISTTAALALGAIALLTGWFARLSSVLTAAMLAGFGFLVWVPALVADPRSASNWSEGTETFLIAGAAWIVADYLHGRFSNART